ncbi:MAG: T9SS type A sorting domain-containing protein [Taibaiella sp.]|nr:T9SS type A sorting domain-containing protein [Taibaiella sp.]
MNRLFLLLSVIFSGSAFLNAQVISSGLYAYYPFNGNAEDEGPNSFDGVVGTATLTYDRFENANAAYYFDTAITDIITMDLPYSYDSFSVCFWINPGTWGRDPYHVPLPFDWRNTSSPKPLLEFHLDNTMSIYANLRDSDNSSGGMILTADSIATKTTWLHIAYVFKAPMMYLYINAALEDSMAYAMAPNWEFNKLSLGLNYWYLLNPSWNTKYEGDIDDIYIFNRPLTSLEVDTIYNETPAPSSVHIVDINSNSISVYPNPNDRNFTLDLAKLGAAGTFALSIIDIKGNIVYEQAIKDTKEPVALPGSIVSGNYILHIISKDKKVVVAKRIVVR